MEEQKIVVTDILKVELFEMALTDLSRRFCYRFVEPIPMIWQTDGQVSYALTMMSQSPSDPICKFLLQKFREVIENSKRQGIWHESLAWLENVNSVEVVECQIVPTGGYTYTSNTATILPPSMARMQEEIQQKVEGR